YADQALVGQTGLNAVSVGGALPKTFFADKVVIPNVQDPRNYDFQTDAAHASGRANQMTLFNLAYGRSVDPANTFMSALSSTGLDAVKGAAQLKNAVLGYTARVMYPNTGLGNALKTLASIIT